MAAITAQMVKDLRERTDLPMMECKQALNECSGDFEAAVEWLRKKYKGKMSDRAGRETGEGRIGVHIDPSRKVGAMIELRCETAPVASNDLFMDLVKAFAQKAAEWKGDLTPDALRADPALDTQFTEVFGRLRETMNLTAARRVEGGFVTSYIHHDGKTGVLIALDAKPSTDAVAADLCMHAAFSKPVAITRDGVPAEAIEKVRKSAMEIAREEGKKEEMVTKIADGKVAAFCAENALVEQLHARSDVYGKKTVGAVLKEAGVNAVTGMVIFKIGS
jgi:elongation factor Ts